MNALATNTTGYSNTASGHSTLYYNTVGYYNVANGATALQSNTTGDSNTATGIAALFTNTTGSSNTGIGSYADVASVALEHATVIGADAIVSTSNTIKLGRSTEDSVVIGQNGAVTSAKLAVVSTTQGFLPPVMTSVQRDLITPTAGLLIFNTTTTKLECYDGTIWQAAW